MGICTRIPSRQAADYIDNIFILIVYKYAWNRYGDNRICIVILYMMGKCNKYNNNISYWLVGYN